jgi:hypothetical protein
MAWHDGLLDTVQLDTWRAVRTLSAEYGYVIATVVPRLVSGPPATITSYLNFLLEEQILVLDRSTPVARSRICYRLQRDGDAAPPRRKSTDARIHRACWTAMRGLKRFSRVELATAAATEGHDINPGRAAHYLIGLHRAGILARLPDSEIYRLPASKNTGPSAPIILPGRRAYDLNTMSIRRGPQ